MKGPQLELLAYLNNELSAGVFGYQPQPQPRMAATGILKGMFGPLSIFS